MVNTGVQGPALVLLLFYLQIKKLQIIAQFVQFKMALVPELVKCVTKSGSAQTRMVVQKL